jgi:hypothetical protein
MNAAERAAPDGPRPRSSLRGASTGGVNADSPAQPTTEETIRALHAE